MNRGGVGARSLNIELQAALNPAGERKVERFGWTFAPGDKVMQIENDYDKEVYNGDIGYVEDVKVDDGELTANFDGRSVTYGFGELDTLVPAYAATIHKSQGSGDTPRGSSPRSACQLPGQHVTLAAVVPGSSVPPFSAVTTVGAGWRCFMAPANYSPADTAMGWSTQANKKPCAKEGLERHRRSERDWAGVRTYSTVFRINRKACTGERTNVYATLMMSLPRGAQQA